MLRRGSRAAARFGAIGRGFFSGSPLDYYDADYIDADYIGGAPSVPVPAPPALANASFAVPEDALPGSLVLVVPNTGGAIASAAITAGNAGGWFAIGTFASGVHVVLANPNGDGSAPLDYETAASHVLTVSAANADGASTATATVNVTDVAEPTSSPATIGAFAVDGAGGAADSVLTFAYAFPKGKLPAGAPFVLRRADTQAPLRTQVNIKNTWPDGSARHVLLAAELPALADGELLGVEARAWEAHPSPGAALNLASALSGRTVRVEISPKSQDDTGTTFGIDLHDPANIPAARFRAGPLAAEARFVVDLPSSCMSTAVRTMGAFTKGAANGVDTLPHDKVLRVYDVRAGATGINATGPALAGGVAYPRVTAWKRAGGLYGRDGNQIDWSGTGAEPATGAACQALYTVGTTASSVVGVRLIVDLLVLKDGTVWVDVAVANDAVNMAGATSANRAAVGFGAKALVDGVAVVDEPAVSLAPYQWFIRCGGRKGAKVMKTGAVGHGWGLGIAGWVRPDVDGLADAEASMRFEKGIVPAAARVNAWTGSGGGSNPMMNRPDWDEPMGIRGWSSWTGGFGATGGRWDLGHCCEVNALMLAHGQRWMHEASHDVHEAMMGVQWHMWDRTGGAAGTGGWLDPTKRPTLVSFGGGANTTPLEPGNAWTNFSVENSAQHVGSTHAMVYLVSGRRTALDGVHAQGAYTVHCNPTSEWRGPNAVPFDVSTGEGVNFFRNLQIRAGSWGLRNMMEADYFSASDHNPNGDYWKRAIEGNFFYLVNTEIPKYTGRHGAIAGFRDYRNYGAVAPWENDFGAPWFCRAARLGYANADAYATWAKNFFVGRFAQDLAVMPCKHGVIYRFQHEANTGDNPLNPLNTGWKTSWSAFQEEVDRLTANATVGDWWDELTPKGLNGRYYGRAAYSAVAAYLDTYPADAAVLLAWSRLWDTAAIEAVNTNGTNVPRITYMDLHSYAVSGAVNDAIQWWCPPKGWTRPAGT